MIEIVDQSNSGLYSQNQDLINNFTDYSSKNLDFDKPVKVYFMNDEENAKDPLGKTGFYNPDTMEIKIYVTGRHLKDILRSISHELIHHVQNCRGDFGSLDSTEAGYAQSNDHLRGMEQEAYTQGNIMNFRDFEDNYKRGTETMSETKINKLKAMVREGAREVLSEQENVAALNALENVIGRWASGKMKDDALKSVLSQAIGGGQQTQAVNKAFERLLSMKRRDLLSGEAGRAAGKKAVESFIPKAVQQAGTQLATTAAKKAGTQLTKTAAKKAGTQLATTSGKAITRKVIATQAGKQAIKQVLAAGAARAATGQAIGSVVPGVGNIVMGVLSAAWLAADVMMLYYDLENLKNAGPQAMGRVRTKCEKMKTDGVPEEKGSREEYDELTKDFAGAIGFTGGKFLGLPDYRRCFGQVMSVRGADERLKEHGLSIDVINRNLIEDPDIGPWYDPTGLGAKGSSSGPGKSRYKKCKTNIQKGCAGDNVKTIQNLLGVKDDGKFWTRTKKAVQVFQRSVGFRPNGIVDEKTLKALLDARSKQRTGRTPDEIARAKTDAQLEKDLAAARAAKNAKAATSGPSKDRFASMSVQDIDNELADKISRLSPEDQLVALKKARKAQMKESLSIEQKKLNEAKSLFERLKKVL